MLRVGLTGGIGSGKSAVAARLAAKGAVVVDADALARQVVAPGTPGLAAVAARFGPGVLAADGSLDRAALAAVVFADAGALADLNAITHPRIAQAGAALVADAPPDAVVVHDVPLLVENGLEGAYDVVVVVDAPDGTRLARLAGRGLDPADARARMAAQASRERRLAAADVVVDNAGALAALDAAVDRLWETLRERASRLAAPD